MGYLERKRIAKCNYFNSSNFFHPHFLLNSSWLQEMKFLSVNWVSTKQISIQFWLCWLILHLFQEKICTKLSIWNKKSIWALQEQQPMTQKRTCFFLRWSYLKAMRKRYQARSGNLLCRTQLSVKSFTFPSFMCFILPVMVIAACLLCSWSPPEFRALQANQRCGQGQCNFTV